MTTQTTQTTRTITLTDRRPVKIVESDWPIVARADGRNGELACRASEEWTVRVRQHDDGRTIVYARRDRGPGGMPIGYSGRSGGEMLAAGDDIAAAIRRVGEDCRIPDAEIRDCIADLPAEEIA